MKKQKKHKKNTDAWGPNQGLKLLTCLTLISLEGHGFLIMTFNYHS